MLCSYPWGYKETLVGRDRAIFHSGAASLLSLLLHATLSKKVTVNRFPRFSQWAIACFLFPLIFQCQGIKCVTHRPVQSNVCLLHALLTWRGKSHDAPTKKKKNPKHWTLFGLAHTANQGRDCEPRSHAGKRWRPRVVNAMWHGQVGGVCLRPWGDHTSRGGGCSCPWRDLVCLQTTWPLRVTLVVYPLIQNILHQLMGPWKHCPHKVPQPPII